MFKINNTIYMNNYKGKSMRIFKSENKFKCKKYIKYANNNNIMQIRHNNLSYRHITDDI